MYYLATIHGGGGGSHSTFSDEEILQPFLTFWGWLRSYKMTIGSHSFSFLDLFVYTLLLSFLLWFIGHFLIGD